MSLRYEVAFDCADRAVGERLADDLVEALRRQELVGAAGGDGAETVAVTIEFPDRDRADAFFVGELYDTFCTEVRERCTASVLVVPLGPSDA